MPLQFSGGGQNGGGGGRGEFEEEERHNEELLDTLKGESSSMVKQLARIESLAEELEEDFAKTNQELMMMKTVYNEGLAETKNKNVASRLSALELENEVQRMKERERRVGGGVGGVREGKENLSNLQRQRRKEMAQRDNELNLIESAAANVNEKQCEEDLKECWSLIEQLQTQLY